jgi:Carboxypeptidase regulatory-like domain
MRTAPALCFCLNLRRCTAFLSCIALLIATAGALHAQAGRGTINGTVTDSTGAVLPDVQVSIKNLQTGQISALTTTSDGSYSAHFLSLGGYEIKATHTGFTTETQTGITLTTDQVATVNFTLKPGTVTSTVEVSATATQLDTTTGAISQEIDQKSIVELPLDGRNPAELVFYAPGAVNGNESTNAIGLPGSGSGFPNPGQETAASVNGSRMGGVFYMLDGVNHMDNYFMNANPFPNPDATQEFRVLTNNFDAQYGFTAGAVVSIATRSGTNSWHGEAFEFLRNNALNASDFFTHQVDPLKRNQFGGSVGGPIKHDKLFVFGNYQQTIEHQTIIAGGTSVPSNAMLNGDFSAVQVQLHDPNGVPYRGNQIPVSQFSPIALELEKGLPKTDDPNGNVILNNRVQINNANEFTVRGDYNITDNQHLSVRYFFNNFNRPAFNGAGDYLDSDRSALARSHNGAVHYTWSLRPDIVNDFVFGYNQINSSTTPGLAQSDGSPLSPAALGANIPQPDETISQLDVNGGFSISQTPVIQQRHNWIFNDSVSINKGRHSIIVGANVFTEYSLEYAGWGADPQMNFSGQVTGNSFADFLLGDMSSFNQSGGEYNQLHAIEFAAFAQDSIKLKPNLTINVGLRWEPQTAPKYSDNKLPFFSPGQQSTRYPNAPTGLVYADDKGVPDGGWNTDWAAIEPRISVAWQPRRLPNTSVRAAFGIMVQPYDFSMYNHMGTTAPFSPQFSLVFNQVYPCVLNIVDPYSCYAPTGFKPPFPPFSGLNFLPASSTSFVTPVSIGATFTPGYNMPRDQTWNFSIEHTINDFLFRVAYVGYEMYHLPVQMQLSPGLFATGGATTLYPDFSNIQAYESWNTQSYNSIQITGEKRFSHGFQFISNYSYAKNLDSSSIATTANVGPIGNPYSLAWNRGVSDLSIPFIWNNTFIYQTPSLKNLGAIGSTILGDWEISGIWTWHSGQPFSIMGPNGSNNSEANINGDRADYVAGQSFNVQQGSKSQWLNEYFNTAAFTANAPGTFGNTARNLLRNPQFNNVDLSLMKNFPFRERYRIQFRWEMFNAFNRTWFAQPDNTVGDLNFGMITSDWNTPRVMQGALKFYF